MKHQPMTAAPRRVRPAFALVVACLAALAACASGPLPGRLAGLRRVTLWTGQRAAAMLAELHGAEVRQASATVADYGAKGQLRVWLVHFPDASKAHEVLGVLLARLSSANPDFAQPQQSAEAPGRWLTIGPEGHQALWTTDATLYWLEGDPAVVSAAIDDLPLPTAGKWT